MRSSATEWLDSLEVFGMQLGLERMRALLERLGNPERRYRGGHVVGTNGKTTTVRTIEALLAAEGLLVGAYTSPHVLGWAERIRIGGEEADFESALERVRPHAEEVGATQFEVVTAAALAEFADAGVDAAVVEAGLGGRLDATNVLGARVVLLTNVSLEHTEVLGETPVQIAREKLAVAHERSIVVLPANTHAHLVPGRDVRLGGAREAAEAFLGRPIRAHIDVRIPGRFELRSERPLEIWDGAHTPEGVNWLVGRLDRRDFVVCASILTDKDVDDVLRRLAAVSGRLVATRSSNPRALDEKELAHRAERFFDHVEATADPELAVARARALAGPDGAILVTGSLYLLADLYARTSAYDG